jgi:FdrA protein
VKRILVKPNRYLDSVFLMRIGAELEKLPGIRRAVVVMGTQANLDSLDRVGFASQASARRILPQDLVIAVDAESSEAAEAATERLEALLAGRVEVDRADDDRPATLAEAVDAVPDANLAVISVPGAYAAREAGRALGRGLHVMLFSDNVSIEDEIALKDEAVENGLLMMGPDCGTAILNGKPLGFANVCRRGTIGIVGASGTGIQEISSLVHRLGGGISQAIGTGGRDLSDAVAGRMTRLGIEALKNDPATDVIVAVSKAPGPSTAERILEALRAAGKPAIVHFVAWELASTGRTRGPTPHEASAGAVTLADTLEEAAQLACERAGLYGAHEEATLCSRKVQFEADQRFVRGLFCGGTLCQEAWSLLIHAGRDVRSNVAVTAAARSRPDTQQAGNVLWDLGDDAFTVGRPHPMIEPTLRDERVARAVEDPTVAVVFVDCVLGYGAHPNPAGSLARAVTQAVEAARARGRQPPVIIASVTGTDLDPQGYDPQRSLLEQAGVLVAESNAAAARQVDALLPRIAGGEM